MRITRLQASGIKGTQIDFAPDRVSIITGPNYSGKTAYQIALDLAILGDSPRFGKSNAATFELSDGAPIDVALDIDGQTVIRRTWTPSGASVTAKKDVSIEFPRILLDLSEVLGAKVSKADRLAYLFRMADAGSALSWEKMAVAIKTALIEEPTEATEKALQQVLELASGAAGETIQDRLQNALGVLAERLKIVNAELRDLQGFVNVQTRQADLDAPVVNAKAKVEKARKELEELRVQQDQAMRAISEYERIAGLLMEATAYEFPEDDEAADEVIARAQNLDQLITEHEQSLAALEYQNCENEFYFQKTEIARLESVNNERLREISRLTQDLGNAKTRRAGLLELECCPTCSANGTDWRAATLLQIDDEIGALCEQRQAIEDKQSGTFVAIDKLQTRHGELAAQVEAVEQLRHGLGCAQRARHDAQNQLRNIAAARHAIELAAAKCAADIANYTAQLSNIDKAALETEYSHIADVVEFARENLQAADKELQLETANRSNELEKQKSLMRREMAQAEQIVLKACGKALQQLQRDAIANSFAPLLEVARKFTDGILRAPLDFHESELGYWHGKKFVKHSTFSGTEESLSYVGLMIALANASQSPVKIAVIDEMGRFDPLVTRPAVMRRMLELTQSGVLDHFIGIDPDARFYDAYYEMDGVKVLDLGGVG